MCVQLSSHLSVCVCVCVCVWYNYVFIPAFYGAGLLYHLFTSLAMLYLDYHMYLPGTLFQSLHIIYPISSSWLEDQGHMKSGRVTVSDAHCWQRILLVFSLHESVGGKELLAFFP
jgi:hypothetical protein